MVTQQRIATELKHERERLTNYLRTLSEQAWQTPSLCEGWSNRDLTAHIVAIASDVANRRLEGIGTAEANQRGVDERGGRSPAELLEEWDDQGALLEAGVMDLDDDFWNAPYSENFTVGHALQRMVEDIWVHAQDIRIPLGEEPYGGPGLISTLEVAAREWEVRLPRLAAAVAKLSVDVGDFSANIAGPGTTDVTIGGDAVTLALVATGRGTLDEAVSAGKLTVSPQAPEGLVEAINIYAG